MFGSLGRPGGPRSGGSRFRNTRETDSSKGSSNDDQNSLDNREILTGPKKRLSVGKREQGQTGNSPSKDDLRGKSREKRAEEKHLSRIKHKINIPTTPPTSPRPKLNTQVTTAPKKDKLSQLGEKKQETGPETKPSPLLNKSVQELLSQSPQSPLRKAVTVPPGGAGAKSPVQPNNQAGGGAETVPPTPPTQSPNIPGGAPTLPAQTQTPAAPAGGAEAAPQQNNQAGGGGVTPASEQTPPPADGAVTAPSPPPAAPAGGAEAAAQTQTPAAPAGGAEAAPQQNNQAGGGGVAPAPADTEVQPPLKIQRKDIGHQPNINNWVDASTDDRDNLGDHIFSVEGEISIVFSKVKNENSVYSVGTEMNIEGELKSYGDEPAAVIDDVFQQSTWLYNIKVKTGEDEDHKFDKKMQATIQKAIRDKSEFIKTLKNKGVEDKDINDVLSINNIDDVTKILSSQKKLVVLFAAIEVLHNANNIEKEDILLLQEIKVVLEAFKTINDKIMPELEKGIYSNEGAEENNAFEDFINHALFLHQKKIQRITSDVYIGCLKVSNITCQVGSFAGVSGSNENITSPSIDGDTPSRSFINSPEVRGSAPSLADQQEELTKKLQEHLTDIETRTNVNRRSREIY